MNKKNIIIIVFFAIGFGASYYLTRLITEANYVAPEQKELGILPHILKETTKEERAKEIPTERLSLETKNLVDKSWLRKLEHIYRDGGDPSLELNIEVKKIFSHRIGNQDRPVAHVIIKRQYKNGNKFQFDATVDMSSGKIISTFNRPHMHNIKRYRMKPSGSLSINNKKSSR